MSISIKRRGLYVGRQNRSSFLKSKYWRLPSLFILLMAFTGIMLESSRGLFSAHQDFRSTSNTIAFLSQRNSELRSVAAAALAEKALSIARSQAAHSQAAHSKAVEAIAQTASLPLFEKESTRVLGRSAERSELPEKLRESQRKNSVEIRLNRVAKHFGMGVNLDSERNSRYDHYFKKYGSKYFGSDVDWRWFKVQAFVESNLRTSARSRVGAVGIMQIMPGTYRHIKKVNRFFRNKSLYSVEWNIAAGIYYNKMLLDTLSEQAAPIKQLQLMFASYNAGMTRILRSVDEKQLVKNELLVAPKTFPQETRHYLRKIDVLMNHYRGRSETSAFSIVS